MGREVSTVRRNAKKLTFSEKIQYFRVTIKLIFTESTQSDVFKNTKHDLFMAIFRIKKRRERLKIVL